MDLLQPAATRQQLDESLGSRPFFRWLQRSGTACVQLFASVIKPVTASRKNFDRDESAQFLHACNLAGMHEVL
jgi:hypothetical protein